MPESTEGKRPRSPYRFFGAGLELAVPVVLLMYVGHRLDGWLGTEPWGMALGALTGIAVGFYSFFRRVLR